MFGRRKIARLERQLHSERTSRQFAEREQGAALADVERLTRDRNRLERVERAHHALRGEAAKLRRQIETTNVERDRSYIASSVRNRVIVHLKSLNSMEGVLVKVYDDSIVLDHAKFLMTGEDVELLEGEQVIPRGNVDWMQRLRDDSASDAT